MPQCIGCQHEQGKGHARKCPQRELDKLLRDKNGKSFNPRERKRVDHLIAALAKRHLEAAVAK